MSEELSHPPVSLGHYAVVDTMEEIIADDRSTYNERYLAGLFLELYLPLRGNPIAVDVINKAALRAVEKGDADGPQRD